MNINSHIQLPNCVLRNFRDETDPEKKVWYLDVQTGDIMRKSSKKLGTRKGYYSETGERLWAENIENPLSIITRKIQKTVQVKYRACRFLLMTQMHASVISRLRLSEAKWRRMK